MLAGIGTLLILALGFWITHQLRTGASPRKKRKRKRR